MSKLDTPDVLILGTAAYALLPFEGDPDPDALIGHVTEWYPDWHPDAPVMMDDPSARLSAGPDAPISERQAA